VISFELSMLLQIGAHDRAARNPLAFAPVCTENVVRIDLVTESPNHPGRWSRSLFLNLLISPLKSTSRLEAENPRQRSHRAEISITADSSTKHRYLCVVSEETHSALSFCIDEYLRVIS
jgi:hypothetical protein